MLWFPSLSCLIIQGTGIHHNNLHKHNLNSNLVITFSFTLLFMMPFRNTYMFTATKLGRYEFFYECCEDERYVTMTTRFDMRRRTSKKEGALIFLPPVLVSVVNMVSFGLPVSSGERILLGQYIYYLQYAGRYRYYQVSVYTTYSMQLETPTTIHSLMVPNDFMCSVWYK